MIAKHSPLQWKNFALRQSFFQLTNPPKDGPDMVDVADLFQDYLIDVDFRVDRTNEGEWHVFAKVLVNWEEPIQSGYRIFVEGSGVFVIAGEDSLEPDKLQNMAYYSTVNLMLNRLRAHIAEITASSVLGAYTLPALDITDLFKQKKALVAKHKAKRAAAKK